jgi:hypothetical protein
MFTNKRKLRRRSLRLQKKSLIIIAGIVLFVGLGSGFTLYFLTIHRQLYVSPIASACKDISVCLGSSSTEDRINTIKKLLSDKQISFSSITNANGAYTVTLPDGSQVLFSGSKDLQLQISSLQYITSRLTMEGRQFKKLDLRFDKPVMTF